MSDTSSPFSVSVPGSLMLMGEHAVVYGRPALAMAVEPRMTLTFTPREDTVVQVTSDLGQLHGDLSDLPPLEPLRFVREAIVQASPALGFEATIQSDLDTTRGWGSSAAVTVGMVAGLRHLMKKPFSLPDIARLAREVIHKVQSRGSGCDAAASTYGGIVRLDPDPFEVTKISEKPLPFSMAYAGYKTPTPDVLRMVAGLLKDHKTDVETAFDLMGQLVGFAEKTIQEDTPETLGALMNCHHEIQASLRTSDETLEKLVQAFREHPQVHGAKISGSGLGDSVIAFGTTEARITGFACDPVVVSPTGVQIYE